MSQCFKHSITSIHSVIQTYISEKAQLRNCTVFKGVIILGNTEVNEGTMIFPYVVIGFPTRARIKNAAIAFSASSIEIKELDNLSSGSRLGKNNIIRSSSILYEEVELGDNVELGHHVMIREQTKIGENTLVGSGTIIDGKCTIGRNVSIQSGVYVPTGTVIGDNVFLGPRVVITNDRYPASKRLVTTVIEDNAVIGANAVLIAGIRIGEGAVIGAGSVVTRDVPPYKVVYGVPARVVSDREEYERKKRKYERGT
ncbi:MAG: N-acetyltransferase [Desulfurococcales archaeon]|nr:N-acetyltransferase [Desulfurococcales archaeon]